MKKLIITLLLGMVSISHAHEGLRHHGYYGGGYYAGNNWIAPAIIGGVIGYELSRPQVYTPPPVIIQQPPVIYAPPQPTIQQPPYGYHWQEMIDPVTNQRKIVLVPN